MAEFYIGDEVEIKGFGRWAGVSLLGEVIQDFMNEFYIVEIDAVTDPDQSDEYLNKPPDESYYIQKQEQYHVVHRHFVRDAKWREDGLEYSIGDVVDWEESYIFVKGRIIGKEINRRDNNNDPNRLYHYVVRLEGSNEAVDAEYYDIRPHIPWA